MSREKQIEEMSNEIREAVNGCSSYWSGLIAGHLYEQGYRKQSDNVIELPCKVGDKVYFNYVELNEICPATVIGIYINYYTPSIPCWVTIEYESQLIGRHEVKIAVDVFNLVCHKTKEEAEAKMKGGAE